MIHTWNTLLYWTSIYHLLPSWRVFYDTTRHLQLDASAPHQVMKMVNNSKSFCWRMKDLRLVSDSLSHSFATARGTVRGTLVTNANENTCRVERKEIRSPSLLSHRLGDAYTAQHNSLGTEMFSPLVLCLWCSELREWVGVRCIIFPDHFGDVFFKSYSTCIRIIKLRIRQLIGSYLW